MLSSGQPHNTRAGQPGEAAEQLKPITVTVATARKITGLSTTTVYALIKKKKIKVVKVGARTLITYASLEALLEPLV
jgi:excisionase family DNA binding protein